MLHGSDKYCIRKTIYGVQTASSFSAPEIAKQNPDARLTSVIIELLSVLLVILSPE